jgi:hypothetical protein
MEYVLNSKTNILLHNNEIPYKWTNYILNIIIGNDKDIYQSNIKAVLFDNSNNIFDPYNIKMLNFIIKTNKHFSNICIRETRVENVISHANIIDRLVYRYVVGDGLIFSTKTFGTQYKDLIISLMHERPFNDLTKAYFECVIHRLYAIIDHIPQLKKLHRSYNVKKFYPLLFILTLAGITENSTTDELLLYYDYEDSTFQNTIDELRKKL